MGSEDHDIAEPEDSAPVMLNYASNSISIFERRKTVSRYLPVLICASVINIVSVALFMIVLNNTLSAQYGGARLLPFAKIWVVYLSGWSGIISGLTALVYSMLIQLKMGKDPVKILLTMLTIFIYPLSLYVPPAIITAIVAWIYLKRQDN